MATTPSSISRQRDLRQTALYTEVEALWRAVRHPGAGLISDVAEVSTNGRQAVFAGTLVESTGVLHSRIALTDLTSGDTRVLTFGPNQDRSPKFTSQGSYIAFLSDRTRAGNFQLYLLDVDSGACQSTPEVHGWVEYLHWSPDGKKILLGVAGHGADVAGVQGAISSTLATETIAPWMPRVDTGVDAHLWRSVWVYELALGTVRKVSGPSCNVWEAAWRGNDAVAAVVSEGPREGLWYTASLRCISLATGACQELFVPRAQLAWPAASPSGQSVAVIEAVCSDRWFVAGDLRIIDPADGKVLPVDTQGVDITYLEWRCDRLLLVAGHRGPETVIGCYDRSKGAFTELWSSKELTSGGFYIAVSGFGESGDCVLVGESFTRAPEIAVIRSGRYCVVKSFDVGYATEAKSIAKVENVSWKATDGIDIEGLLLRPLTPAPHPLVMIVHGGPVWHWRPMWLGRFGALYILRLVGDGYAVFLPNPRGSSGRGQAFAGRVVADMGGADAMDCLAGVDHLIRQRVADPHRLGVTGISYGGYMTAWLITQDPRFAAAVTVAPVTNFVTAHLLSNIPDFVALFLADSYRNANGKYYQRSPVMFAHQVRTPTMNICGALDRCTPPAEAAQFHQALQESGVDSVLITYPEEGHGIRKFPAIIDYICRLVAWFHEHMSPAEG